jgi:FkbM family methyltransferase
MKEFLKRILPAPVVAYIRREKDIRFNSHRVPAYSQEGEDLILRRLFGEKTDGYYVDVGAYHPRHLSNTCLFYEQGWSGLNIDARAGTKALFDRIRPKDVNLELALSSDGRELEFTSFDNPAVSTFKRENVEWALRNGCRIVGVQRIPTTTLAAVLDQHHDPSRPIDFMSIDVEGMDLEVLRGNNWAKYRPGYLLVEAYGSSLEGHTSSEMGAFLNALGYRLCAMTVNTFIYSVGQVDPRLA